MCFHHQFLHEIHLNVTHVHQLYLSGADCIVQNTVLVQSRACVRACVRVRAFVRARMHDCVFACACACVCVRVCVCMLEVEMAYQFSCKFLSRLTL